MDLTSKIHTITPLDKEAKLSGMGANHLWDGPLDTTAYPKGKGSSSGKNGIKLRFASTPYSAGPITQKAKGKY